MNDQQGSPSRLRHQVRTDALTAACLLVNKSYRMCELFLRNNVTTLAGNPAKRPLPSRNTSAFDTHRHQNQLGPLGCTARLGIKNSRSEAEWSREQVAQPSSSLLQQQPDSKSGTWAHCGSQNGPANKEEGSNKKQPPATQVMRVKQPGSHSAAKKEKRYSSSCFHLSTNRELQKLPPLSGPQHVYTSVIPV
ncbi:Serine/threonine-protein phosphatase 2A regulatory subunit delta isoform [Merluccius polli]|uniref:Serine/threonine-protein phosphatase 2A regulatory subunit delta isoform n=1 Tax=Merluccius polli TaxID=89951 RepID=A0AA47N6K3_MERPO|nr:Serine/threonine-protein phosphatase 2A regulatory subunit delta isoform [Merluccius polli]